MTIPEEEYQELIKRFELLVRNISSRGAFHALNGLSEAFSELSSKYMYRSIEEITENKALREKAKSELEDLVRIFYRLMQIATVRER